MIDPRTPVVIGVGQVTERIDDADYRALSPVELAAEAARHALADSGADPTSLAAAVDTIVATRQFEISVPNAPAPLGKSNNFPRSVAARIGADPARAVLDKVGGQGPQALLTEFAAAIAADTADVVVLCGSDATSTARHFAPGADGVPPAGAPDFHETVEGQLEDRGFGLEEFVDRYTISHGLTGAPVQYGLLENARRARLGLTPAQYLQAMGELFAPFTAVAAGNPLSASPVQRSVDDLVTISTGNRMICDPYPRLLVARDQVNQGAAVVVASVAAARRLGVPESNWVYLHGHADLREQPLLERPDLGRSPAAVAAVTEALAVAGIGLDDVAALDLYSCFPIPVFNICDAFALSAEDPRGLTLTGGLPFFGGAGNNYSMHAIAEAVTAARRRPGRFSLVGANGGMMSKYSVGVYATTPTGWRGDDSRQLQAELDAVARVPVTETAEGRATIETYSVRYDWPTRTGIIIGRLADGTRFLATSEDDDLVALLSDGEPLGAEITVRALDYGNRCSLR
ncbi:acetyl-CoA acetyltransferase [Mycobacterium koreense]|uniref:Acetyl-CoA acetyltransferase n=1 Tax=Mycolicibacillus koreensis TaxID=1069220 RepID=A0A7I7SJF0_9MYCO|nr:acetyl-CoA acetyltransferase [Mycolicibacillus koreensis]MCV7247449.1 acetyl-CoA acetyltransferase [Mycolicibacillus koreensis]OSC33927.1 acetyl-CoA acetyltransferase [Mycolicibacillus koreensis]BBY56650.1 acetyl-CoA acetyltransferase [Mycolicibacillus koreensis]